MVLTKCSGIKRRPEQERDFLEMLPGGWQERKKKRKVISAVKEANKRAGVSPLHFALCPRAKWQQRSPPAGLLLQTRGDTTQRRVSQKSFFIFFVSESCKIPPFFNPPSLCYYCACGLSA